MQALKFVITFLMLALLLGASYFALGDLCDPAIHQKAGSIILWLIIAAPTVGMVHWTFRRTA